MKSAKPSAGISSPTPLLRFRVLQGEEPRPVELVFGGDSDLALLRDWRLPPMLRRHEPARDALAFARLATKRWRYHRRTGHVVSSAEEIRNANARQSRAELAFLLLARADWHSPSPVLGLAHCRRTWCGHIFLDFLSVHPRVVARQGLYVQGVGTGILCGLCELAAQWDVPLIWGETTETSVTFYRRILRAPSLLDGFTISGVLLEQCRREFRRWEILEP